MIETSIDICETADVLLIIGTSMQVYPAAGLMNYVPHKTPVYFIDPKPAVESTKHITVIADTATNGMTSFIELLK